MKARISSTWLCFTLAGCFAFPVERAAEAPSTPPRPADLAFEAGRGLVWHAAGAEVWLDSSGGQPGPVLRWLTDGREVVLANPKVEHRNASDWRLVYEVALPGSPGMVVTRTLHEHQPGGARSLVESFQLRPGATIQQDLEIVRPFAFRSPGAQPKVRGEVSACLPLKNGWAKPVSLREGEARAEYRLGHWIGSEDTPELALPLVQFDLGETGQAAVLADPRFSSLCQMRADGDGVSGEVRYRYQGSQVPLEGVEERHFGFWLNPAGPREFGAAVDAFFDSMLADVPPGPKWLHDIAMVGYDFLSDNGLGWERDIRLLESWLEPGERRRVALCLHGWYDALGAYSFDESTGRLRNEWTAMARTRKVQFTPGELRRRLRLARDRGFRVLLYFGDGLAADSGAPGYHDEWAWRDAAGNRVSGWQGPDTFGPTYMMNPAHPQVQRRFHRYLEALLSTVGADVDGFVWDETFHARGGQIAAGPVPAYCDRAMFDLVKSLTQRVHQLDPQKAFLASDCVGIAPNIPGYAMVADGLYQDTHCDPARWPEALFPNWRNTFWSCNWGPRSHFHWTRYGVEQFGAPVAISNGWDEDHGPSEWTEAEHDAVLALFRQRVAAGPGHVRYLTQDPSKLLSEKGPGR